MTEAFTKTDIAKVKKWEKALDSLKTGERSKVNITSLLGIKSLCHDKQIRHAYCFYLFDCIKNRIEVSSKNTFEVGLINEISETLEDMKNGNDVKAALYEYQNTLFNYRSEIEKHSSADLRFITYSESLTLAYLVRTLLASGDNYAMSVYYATRIYVEKYNSSVGTGLIADSIPFFEDVLEFWKGVALATKLNASRK
jgi:hypothetical protein